jgi:hypothetical protein
MPGSTQHWSKSVNNITAGDQRVRLTRMGNMIRSLVLVFRDTTPARSTTNFPDPFRLELDGKVLMVVGRTILRRYMWERSILTLGAFDTGVVVLDFAHDFDGRIGHEVRDQWLPTTQATRLEIVGNFGAAGTLSVLTNDVALAGGVSLPNG